MGLLNRIFRWTQYENMLPATPKTSNDDNSHNGARIRDLYGRALGNDPLVRDPESRQRAAISLMLADETAKARNAWLAIARDHPAQFALALEQVGSCYHLEGAYQSALDNYQAAIRVGADPSRLSGRMTDARKGMAIVG